MRDKHRRVTALGLRNDPARAPCYYRHNVRLSAISPSVIIAPPYDRAADGKSSQPQNKHQDVAAENLNNGDANEKQDKQGNRKEDNEPDPLRNGLFRCNRVKVPGGRGLMGPSRRRLRRSRRSQRCAPIRWDRLCGRLSGDPESPPGRRCRPRRVGRPVPRRLESQGNWPARRRVERGPGGFG